MIGRLLLRHRLKKTQKRYSQLSYELRPRLQATALVGLLNPEWLKDIYTVQRASAYTLNVRTSDPGKLVTNLQRILTIIVERKNIDDRYKVSTPPRNVKLPDWLEDKDRRVISAYVVAKELKRLIPAVSKEIAECELSREDLFDYYQMYTLAYMEDAVEFLEAILSLKLTK